MAITNGYCTLDEVKRRLGIDDAQDNTDLEGVIEGASRFIDNHTGRVFYTTENEARYYTAAFSDTVYIDDAYNIDAVATDDDSDRTYSTSWAGTDWETDAPAGWPIAEIYTTPNGTKSFPTTRRAVRVTADWGFAAAVPDAIREAAVLLSMRFWKRRDAVLGVAGAPALGVQVVTASIRADADIQAMLQPYRKLSWR